MGKTITIGPAKTVGRGKSDYGDGLRPVSDYLKAVKGFFPNISNPILSFIRLESWQLLRAIATI